MNFVRISCLLLYLIHPFITNIQRNKRMSYVKKSKQIDTTTLIQVLKMFYRSLNWIKLSSMQSISIRWITFCILVKGKKKLHAVWRLVICPANWCKRRALIWSSSCIHKLRPDVLKIWYTTHYLCTAWPTEFFEFCDSMYSFYIYSLSFFVGKNKHTRIKIIQRLTKMFFESLNGFLT